MKLLSIPFLVVLAVDAQADRFILLPEAPSTIPIREMVTIYEMPSYPASEIVYVGEHFSSGIITPVPYTAAKPTEKLLAESGATLLRTLEPLTSPSTPQLAPRLPLSDKEQCHEIVLGQNRSVDELAGLLGSQPPLAQGAVEEGMIDPKLAGVLGPAEFDPDALAVGIVQGPTQSTSAGQQTKFPDPLGYTVLLMATTVTTIWLVYMIYVAYDYRQRWMQSSAMQNDRYLSGGFDMEMMEDIYGAYSGSSPFSEGFGLTRRSI